MLPTMNPLNFNMTLEDITNMDMRIDFYDTRSMGKFGIDPLPLNKNFKNFWELFIQQNSLLRDICNIKCVIAEIINSDTEIDPTVNLTKQEAKKLFLKYVIMETVCELRRKEIIRILDNSVS